MPAKQKTTKIDELTPDARNANKGTERGSQALEQSLRRHGAGRSILIDKHGRVIAGNKTLETAAAIGLEDVVVVQTDGRKLVAVQRTDLDLDTPEARALAYADNRVGELDLAWDAARIVNDLEAGIDFAGLFTSGEMDVIVRQMEGYAPEYDPDAGHGAPVTDADVATAQDSLEARFAQARANRQDVVCPECGHAFLVDGLT